MSPRASGSFIVAACSCAALAFAFNLARPTLADGDEEIVRQYEDLDGDDHEDEVKAEPEPEVSPGQPAKPGTVTVTSGRFGDTSVEIRGLRAADLFGWDIQNHTDLNGDGQMDLLIGAPGAFNDEGRVYLYYGPLPADGSKLTAFDADLVFRSPYAVDFSFGERIGTVPDLDGDGLKDIRIQCGSFDNGVELTKTYLLNGAGQALLQVIDGQPFDAWAAMTGDVTKDSIVEQHDLRTRMRLLTVYRTSMWRSP